MAPAGDLGFCNVCGAEIVGRCPSCDIRIPGVEHVPGISMIGEEYVPSKFCDGCGEPYPWASRQDRIYQLENLLGEEQIDEPTRLLVMEDLERVRTESNLPDKDELEVWRRIKDRAPGLFGGAAFNIVENLVSAYIWQRLGL
jgi:hypothetical protein